MSKTEDDTKRAQRSRVDANGDGSVASDTDGTGVIPQVDDWTVDDDDPDAPRGANGDGATSSTQSAKSVTNYVRSRSGNGSSSASDTVPTDEPTDSDQADVVAAGEDVDAYADTFPTGKLPKIQVDVDQRYDVTGQVARVPAEQPAQGREHLDVIDPVVADPDDVGLAFDDPWHTSAQPATYPGTPTAGIPMPGTATVAGRRKRIRKVNRVVRHIDPWSVFKVGLLFSLIGYVVLMTTGVLLWNVASRTGTLPNVERWFTQFGWESFSFDGRSIFSNTAVAGLFGAVGLTGSLVMFATVFNLVSDAIGGIRISVLEEEVIAVGDDGLPVGAVPNYVPADVSQHQVVEDWAVEDF